jgi:hypothetical protein
MNVNTLVQSVQENAFDLGLTWNLQPGTVVESGHGLINVQMDSDQSNTIIQAISLLGFMPADARVMLLSVPPSTIFVLGLINNNYPTPGTAIVRVRQETPQSIVDAGAGTFLTWDAEDYDPFSLWSSGTDVAIPFDGYYQVNTRGVFAANATSRRAAFANKNNTTSGTGTICGASIQAPATGTCQLGGSAIALLLTSDVVGTRVIQNSGAPLNTSSSDGGSELDLTWLGPAIT